MKREAGMRTLHWHNKTDIHDIIKQKKIRDLEQSQPLVDYNQRQYWRGFVIYKIIVQ